MNKKYWASIHGYDFLPIFTTTDEAQEKFDGFSGEIIGPFETFRECKKEIRRLIESAYINVKMSRQDARELKEKDWTELLP